MKSFLRALAILVIAAAVVRGVGLLRFAADRAPNGQDALDLRQLLSLPSHHRISGLIASNDLPHSTGILWWDGSASATAILADADGRLRVGHPQIDATEADPSLLTQLDPSPWPELPPQWQQLTVHYWDAAAAVYVTAGSDGQPGIAGIDDDGNGSIDDLAELGATGSDDFVVAPGQYGYEQAAGSEILARLISRGALVPLDGELQLPPQRPLHPNETLPEVWLEFSAAPSVPPQRIVLRGDI